MSSPATAESNRIRSSKAELHAYFATRCATVRLHLVLVFFLFFAPSYRDRPRFVRVDAYYPRLTDDGASTRLPPTVNSEKGAYPPRVLHTVYGARIAGGVRQKEAWSVFSAPVSNCHGPLPQPRSQQGECVSSRFTRRCDKELAIANRKVVVVSDECSARKRREIERQLCLPILSHSPLLIVRHLTYLRASCHPHRRYYSGWPAGPSERVPSSLGLSRANIAGKKKLICCSSYGQSCGG